MTLPPFPHPSSDSEVSAPQSPTSPFSGVAVTGRQGTQASRDPGLYVPLPDTPPPTRAGRPPSGRPSSSVRGDRRPGCGPGSAAPGGQSAALDSQSSSLRGRSPPPRPRAFFSLYHKYINYANYGHCILTKFETSPARPPPPPCKALPAPDPATHRSPKPSLPLPGCPAATG